MSKCDCYHIETHRRYTYNPMTGTPIGHDVDIGVCWGTRECEECSCGGDENKCNFYPEVRKRGRKKRQPKFGEWTSVEDRLPEIETENIRQHNRCYSESIRVLCACKQRSGKVMVKEGYCRIYDDNNICWKIPGSIDSVTHWMPLPEPPKGEEI